MRLRIHERIPAELGSAIRECVAFGFHGVTPSARVEVRVRPARGASGQRRGLAGITYYYCPADALPGAEVVVTISLPFAGDVNRVAYPWSWSYPGLKRAPLVTFGSWQEELVHVAAHEAHHVRQYRRAGVQSEIAAERTAGRRLTAWRARP